MSGRGVRGVPVGFCELPRSPAWGSWGWVYIYPHNPTGWPHALPRGCVLKSCVPRILRRAAGHSPVTQDLHRPTLIPSPRGARILEGRGSINASADPDRIARHRAAPATCVAAKLAINEPLLRHVEHLAQPRWHMARARLREKAPRFAEILSAGAGRNLKAMQRALEIDWTLSTDAERLAFRQALRLAQQVEQSACRAGRYRAAKRLRPTPPASMNHTTDGAKI